MIAEVTERIEDAKFLGDGTTSLCRGTLFSIVIEITDKTVTVDTPLGPLVLPADKVKFFDPPALTYEGNPHIWNL